MFCPTIGPSVKMASPRQWRRRRNRTVAAWGLIAVGAVVGAVHFVEMIGVWAILPMSLHFAYYPLAALFMIATRGCVAWIITSEFDESTP